MPVSTLDGIPQVFGDLFIFVLWLDNLNWPIFRFTKSFFCLLKSAVKPLCWIFCFSYCTCQLLNFFLSLFIISISFLIFFIWWDIVLRLAFSSLDMISFGSLNIFKVAYSIPFWINPKSCLLENSFYWLLFPSVCGSYFVSACLTILSWKLDILSNKIFPSPQVLLLFFVVCLMIFFVLFCEVCIHFSVWPLKSLLP